MEKNLETLISQAQQIVANSAMTHEQAMTSLASLPGQYANVLKLPEGFAEMEAEGLLCNLSEGYLPYCPRYIPEVVKIVVANSQIFLLAC